MLSKVGHDLDDAVIRGESSSLPVELVSVAEALAVLRSRAAAEPAPPMSAALRAQLEAPNVVALRAARSMRRAVVVAAAAAAAVVVVGVGAAQNRLPGPVQDVVASTAELVGIDVPRSDERGSTRSEQGVEHVRDATAPAGLAGSEPGAHAFASGSATPAVPGGSDGPAAPATPPEKEGPEKADKPEKPDTAEQPATPQPVEPQVPEGAPGQDEGVPPASARGGSSTPEPPSQTEGEPGGGGARSDTTPAANAPNGDD